MKDQYNNEPFIVVKDYSKFKRFRLLKQNRLTQNFEEEKRAIQAQTTQLLKRCHERVPKVTVRVIPLSSINRYYDSPIHISSPYRLSSPLRRVADNILNISHYNEPAAKFTGSGHLACIRFSGQKPYDRRRNHLSDLTDHVIRNDINLLSYYLKNRQAAEAGDIEKPLKAIEKPEQSDESKQIAD